MFLGSMYEILAKGRICYCRRMSTACLESQLKWTPKIALHRLVFPLAMHGPSSSPVMTGIMPRDLLKFSYSIAQSVKNSQQGQDDESLCEERTVSSLRR